MRERTIDTALIVDDHPLFCEALCLTLQAVAEISQVETVDCLDAAMERLSTGARPDVIVLDLNLPDVTGIDGLVRLKTIAGDSPIIVVSSLTGERIIEAAYQAGAAGFVPKHSGRETFRRAFGEIRAGGTFLPEGFTRSGAGAKATTLREKALARLALLTRQQARILQLICEGKLNKQIAYELAISETTVKAHITAIMRKLGTQRRTQAVLIAKEASFAFLVPEAE